MKKKRVEKDAKYGKGERKLLLTHFLISGTLISLTCELKQL